MKQKLSLVKSVIPHNKVLKRTQTAPEKPLLAYNCRHCNCQCGGSNK